MDPTRPAGPGADPWVGSGHERTHQARSGLPEGEPPTDLVITDEIVGDGTEATAGKTVSATTWVVAFSTGEEFDSSWNRGQPLDFPVGAGMVIQGWDQGLLGMKVGGAASWSSRRTSATATAAPAAPSRAARP